MEFQIGLENNTEGRSIAWALGHPGCFAYGSDGTEALSAAPQAIHKYMGWVSARATPGWFADEPVSTRLVESWDCYSIGEDYELKADGYEVNAWFRDDWKPLTEDEVTRGLLILAWSRVELLQTVKDLNLDILERSYPGERWSIAGILAHIANADWWYLDRLGLASPRSEMPSEPFERLEMVRAGLIEILPRLVGSHQVVGIDGEFWSPRKLLRRAAWHERDHIQHIRKLL